MGDAAFTLILMIVGIAAAILFAGTWSPRVDDIERGLPAELRGAEIAHAEGTFRSHRHGLVARLDRAYRIPGGLQLVELKTRPHDAVHMSDLIELSVQKIALEDATGETVSDQAWVVVQDARSGARSPRKVRLMGTSDIMALRERYADVVRERVVRPAPARSPSQCRQCAHKAVCSTRFQDRA